MKINYRISWEEFRTLQPPLRRHRESIGFFLVIGLAFLILIGPGIGLIAEALVRSQRIPAPAMVSVTLGLLVCFCVYLLDRNSRRHALERRERELIEAYDRIHCRDARTAEAASDALSVACRCGVVSQPWSELTGFTETAAFLIPITRTESLPIPKSAFESEGELTEFRRIILDQLHTDRPFNAHPIEFAHTPRDFWHAKLLHIRKGGGWRRILKLGVPSAAFVFVIALSIARARTGRAPAFVAPLALVGFAAFLTLTVRPQKRYYGPLQIYFSDEGFHVVDPGSQSRRRWSEAAGYLEDRHVYLLYLNPRLYRIIPKRALGNRVEDFDRLVQAALPRFDYRRRIPLADTAQV